MTLVLLQSSACAALVGQWVANDWTGGTANWVDRVGGKVATVASAANSPAKVAGAFAGGTATAGLVFDGVNDYFAVSAAQNPIVGKTSVTILAYFKTTQGASGADGSFWRYPGPLNAEAPGNPNDWGLTYNAAGQAQGLFNNQISPVPAVSLINGQPHTLILTWQDPTNFPGQGVARLYVDGVLAGSTGPTDGGAGIVNWNFVIGSETEQLARYFRGTIGELRFYDSIENPATLHASVSTAPAAPPSVTTTPASVVGPSTATLNGSVTPNGAATNAYFQYATNVGLTGATTTANQAIGSGASPVVVNQPITGLAAHTQYFFRAAATNGSGSTNGSTLSFTTTNTSPTAPGASIGATTGDQQTYTLPFPSTDADGDTVTLVSVTPGPGLTVNSTSGKMVTFTPAGNFSGSTSFFYMVSDGFGGMATGSIAVNIADNDAPVVTAPANITVFSTGTSGAVVTFSPTASDNIGVTSLTSSPASGSTFPLGTTPVSITALDAAGNAGMGSFTVTVNQAPSFYDFTAATFAAPEGNTTNASTVVTVTRSGNTWDSTSASVVLAPGPTNPATVGTDFTAGPVAVNFSGGQTSKAASIQFLGETIVELNETIALSFAANAGGTRPTAVLTLTNDDTATVLLADTSVAEGDSGTATMTFTATVDHAVDVPFTVGYTIADGTATLASGDFGGPLSGTLNFAGTAGEMQTFTLAVNGDCAPEPDETVRASLGAFMASGREPFLRSGGPGSGGPQSVFTNVPEASAYTLVYDLAIPNTLNFQATIPYTTNNSASIPNGSFDRIAYYLELNNGSGLQYVYVSVDAFTPNTALIGVPSFAGSNSVFQQTLANMNVVSNKAGIITGTGIATGNIEFWPFNYDVQNAISIPGANPINYDFGDRHVGSASYGSMQIHNYGGGQTLFALNNFQSNTPGEMGIGNQVGGSGQPDWTFSNNGGSYTVKNLQILVRAGEATGTILNDDYVPQITGTGIPDTSINTSNPSGSVALFPYFQDVDDADTALVYSVRTNSNPALVQTSAINSANGILGLTTPCTLKGFANITIRATDPCGLWVEDTFRVTVIDNVPPVIEVKDIVVTIPASLTEVSLTPFAFTAFDKVDGVLPAPCSPDGTLPFPVGVTPVLCSSTDSSGNTGMATFNVVVLLEQDTGAVRYLDAVNLRGDAVSGPNVPVGATLFNVNNAYLNNSGGLIYDAVLTGAGASNVAVFTGPVAGPHSVIAVKAAAALGGGVFGAFSNLSLNDGGTSAFQSAIGANPGAFSSFMGAVSLAAVRGGLAPTGGGEEYISLQKPALASEGSLLVTGSLRLTSGAGVTTGDDTLLVRGNASVLAREGSPSSIPATDYGQLHSRVVASEDNARYAFSSFLLEPVFDPSDNTALFVGILGGGVPQMVVREADIASGTGGGQFSIFLGECVNSSGAIALRANLAIGPRITAANNEGLWTNSPNTGAPPVLVAREGDVAPCLGTVDAAFDRFSTFHLADDGSVCFLAYLKNAIGATSVHSGNDGSLWRWRGGRLYLIAREGDTGNNTPDIIRSIGNFACSGTGGVAYDVSFVPGFGNTTSSTNLGIYLDRGAADPAPLLVLRRDDTFEIGGTDYSVAGMKISTESNPGGGTGGYGRALNDAGDILLNLTLSGNTSGLFLLGTPPP